ncbi:uncharacterized protein ASCRUDRAFT_70273 [Ascoidea rubescens DSM 1968]|uniref:Uncharacterized protein n=1 Tax=Ascoidea rubescens DSM 1968 TaxID=1344418 RepID=A0A1D2VHH3_9ASCO|nr:hypothetical protein ASCRUDRAFT_70273 [Ascoidea rubescens DSM 1968]ODV61042.1 hypothetical protein ASCRUDRAFT_70273 [Ascoidea rubescens DSM 1968]
MSFAEIRKFKQICGAFIQMSDNILPNAIKKIIQGSSPHQKYATVMDVDKVILKIYDVARCTNQQWNSSRTKPIYLGFQERLIPTYRLIAPLSLSYGFIEHPNLNVQAALQNLDDYKNRNPLEIADLYIKAKYVSENKLLNVKETNFKEMSIKGFGNLQKIHLAGIPHGDIHLDNVIYNDKVNTFYYLDFGSSSTRKGRSNCTKPIPIITKGLHHFIKKCSYDYECLIDLLLDYRNYRKIDFRFLEAQRGSLTTMAQKNIEIEREKFAEKIIQLIVLKERLEILIKSNGKKAIKNILF